MVKLVVDIENYYTVDEAAAVLHKGTATIWRMIRDGRLQSILVADERAPAKQGWRLIPKAEVHKLIPKKEVEDQKKEGK